MSDARSDIFARIREALKVKAPKPHLKGEPVAGKTSAVAKPWLPDGGESADASLAILAEQLAKLKAVLIRVPDQAAAAKAVAELAAAKNWKDDNTTLGVRGNDLSSITLLARANCSSWLRCVTFRWPLRP